jgi:hypothetical protein
MLHFMLRVCLCIRLRVFNIVFSWNVMLVEF